MVKPLKVFFLITLQVGLGMGMAHADPIKPCGPGNPPKPPVNPYTSGYPVQPPSFDTYFNEGQRDLQEKLCQLAAIAQRNSTVAFVPASIPQANLQLASQVRTTQAAIVTAVDTKNYVRDSQVQVNKYNSKSVCNCDNKEPAIKISQPKPKVLEKSTVVQKDPDSCTSEVTNLPGSHEFASGFMESIAADKNNPQNVYAITADMSTAVPLKDRAMYVSKSTDGGKTWASVARLAATNADASLQNSISVTRNPKDPNKEDIVVTTLKGAVQLSDPPETKPSINSSGLDDAVVIPIDSAKDNAGAVKILDSTHMVVAYGYFDGHPELVRYTRDAGGGPWTTDTSATYPPLKTNQQILSLETDPKNPKSLYIGTGNQAYHLNPKTQQWDKIAGVGDDSAVQSMSTVGGLHMATCWGVYDPSSKNDVEKKAASKKFIWDGDQDAAGTKIRAYGIDVNPANHKQIVVAAATGMYSSQDGGKTWSQYKVGLPPTVTTGGTTYDAEYRTVHFDPDGSGAVIVSGKPGTYLVNPFAKKCSDK